MKKMALALFALALSLGFAQAHALYIIVNGEKVQVIFSDNLNTDAKIKEEESIRLKIEGLATSMRRAL